MKCVQFGYILTYCTTQSDVDFCCDFQFCLKHAHSTVCAIGYHTYNIPSVLDSGFPIVSFSICLQHDQHLEIEHAGFRQASFNYVCKLQEVHAMKQYELIEPVSDWVCIPVQPVCPVIIYIEPWIQINWFFDQFVR